MSSTVARFSRLFIPTLKEAPTDAQVVSHKLLVRAGFIRQLGAGIYDYLPTLMREMRAWKYRPYLVRDRPTSVCTAEAFIYRP